MGKVSPFQRLRTDHDYSEEELKDLAFEKFCSVADSRTERIAWYVGRSKQEVERWMEEGSWSVRRAAAKKKKRDEELAAITKLLAENGLQNQQQSAVETLSVCQRVVSLAKKGLESHGQHGVAADVLEKYVHAIERVQKIQKEAYSRIGTGDFNQ